MLTIFIVLCTIGFGIAVVAYLGKREVDTGGCLSCALYATIALAVLCFVVYEIALMAT